MAGESEETESINLGDWPSRNKGTEESEILSGLWMRNGCGNTGEEIDLNGRRGVRFSTCLHNLQGFQ